MKLQMMGPDTRFDRDLKNWSAQTQWPAVARNLGAHRRLPMLSNFPGRRRDIKPQFIEHLSDDRAQNLGLALSFPASGGGQAISR